MRSKLVCGAVGGPEFPKQPDDAARHFRRHGRTASHGLPQGFQQARRRRFLEQVTGSPRAQRLKNPIVIFVHGQHQDRQAGMTLLENPNALDAAHAGKPDVIEDDMGLVLSDAFQSVFHGAVSAGATEARGAVDDHRQSLANLAAVFDDSDADRSFGYGGHGISSSLVAYLFANKT